MQNIGENTQKMKRNSGKSDKLRRERDRSRESGCEKKKVNNDDCCKHTHSATVKQTTTTSMQFIDGDELENAS
ncbi:unnamed protein product [Nippostrongylus brasiliensis]|uniref:Uncharacterized protein n=1 Tax=Nippostrongylus brasiliensis TaxID=27835 RepID=A0A0N4XV69_NIPBR|nr:unnamed protein product [Nippostrongylus brasiliensis]